MADAYTYFMIRVHRPGEALGRRPEADTFAGVVERLDTGEKLPFARADQLLRFLSGSPPAGDKLWGAEGPSNARDEGGDGSSSSPQ